MRYDAEHKARTRARVLEEASRALRSAGPQGIGVAEIMSRAGLTHGGFYAHFGSKDELVTEALSEAFRDGARMFEQATEGREPRPALASYIDIYLSRGHRDASQVGCPLPALAAEMPRLGDEPRRRFAGGISTLSAGLQALLDAAGHEDADVLAGSVMAELVGAVALARALPAGAQSDAVLANCRNALLGRLGLAEFA